MARQGGVQLVEERVVNDAYDRLFLVQEADGDARKGEAVHEVCSSICGHVQSDMYMSRLTRATIPIGSTQNVGASVNGGRVPSVYDSSPILTRSNTDVNDNTIAKEDDRAKRTT